jgi:hypothetical protein
MEICEGDCLLVTGNGYTGDNHRLNNRDTHTVDYITHKGEIVLKNGWKLDRGFKHLDYGFALTAYAAQGKTVDWVFLAQSAELSYGASDLRQFHVSTSRGRKGVKVYTDDIELLTENVSLARERPMAMEMLEAEAQEIRPVEIVADNEMKDVEVLGKQDALEVRGEAEAELEREEEMEM